MGKFPGGNRNPTTYKGIGPRGGRGIEPVRPAKPLTDEQVGELRQRARDGESVADLAAELGAKVDTVRSLVNGHSRKRLNKIYPPVKLARGMSGRKVGLTTDQVVKIRRAARKGEHHSYIASQLGISASSAFYAIYEGFAEASKIEPALPKASRRVLTNDEVEEILQRAANDWPRKIAQDMGLTYSAIYCILNGKAHQHIDRGKFHRKVGNANSVISDRVVIEARQRAKNGETVSTLSDEYVINYATLAEAVKGKTYQWLNEGETPRPRDPWRPTATERRLTKEIVIACRRRHRQGESQSALAREFDVNVIGLHFAVVGRTWKSLNGIEPPVSAYSVPRTKLTGDQVIECRRRAKRGESGDSLAREFGVASQTMHCALVGKRWTSVNDQEAPLPLKRDQT